MGKNKQIRYTRYILHDHIQALQDVVLIQELIKAHSSAPRKRGKYKGHSISDVRGWMKNLIDLLVPKGADRKDRDGNLYHAKRVGLALFTWYVKVGHAKAMDPRRPIERRKIAHTSVTEAVGSMAKAMFDDALDSTIFSGQEWESPYDKNARDGDFV